jgi:hypothetical protein
MAAEDIPMGIERGRRFEKIGRKSLAAANIFHRRYDNG